LSSVTIGEAPAAAAGLIFVQLAGIAPSLDESEGRVAMPAKSAQPGSGGFSAAERNAMKQRAAELQAEGKKGPRRLMS
jgi:hypothetical protein